MKKFLGLGALALFFALTGCSDNNNDSVDNNNTDSATVTATINGEEWTGTVTSATLIKVSQMGQQRLDITAEDSEQRITLTCSSEIANGVPAQDYFFDEESENVNALFTNSYLIGGTSYMEHFCDQGTMTVTSSNSGNSTVSGTFSFTAYKVGTLQDVVDTPETVTVTNGAFSNVHYTTYDQ